APAFVSGVRAVPIADPFVWPALSWSTLTVAGDALIEKSGLAVTTNDTVVVCVADGAVPVIVTVYVPGVVAAPAVRVSVDEPPAVTLVGANVAVAPAGKPLAVSAIVSAVPAVTAGDTVVVPELPWTTVTVAGDALIEKSFVDGFWSSQKPRP